jgi:Putative porin
MPASFPRTLLAAMSCAAASLPAMAQTDPPPASAPPPAAAADARAGLEELRATTLALIQALVDQGLLTRERAQALVQQAQRAGTPPQANASAAPAAGWGRPAGAAVRVPFVPESVRNEIRDQVREEVMASVRSEAGGLSRQAADWLKRITIDGDVRVRGQRDLFDPENIPPEVFRAQTESPAWAPDLTNTRLKRDRQTVRARLGVQAQVSDSVAAGLRLGTGNGPVSGSQTLGNDYSRFATTFDRAWLRWSPLSGVSIEGGRMATPFFSTDLIWPEDLSLDGVAVRVEQPIGAGFEAFGTLLASPLEELSTSRDDKWLYAAQLGASWKPSDSFTLRAAVAYYDFREVAGVRETELPPVGPLAGTVDYFSTQYPATVRQKGNTLINLNAPGSIAAPTWGLASQFRPIDMTLGATWWFGGGLQVSGTLDYVKNSAFDLADIQRRAATVAVSDLADKTTGFQGRVSFGTQRLTEAGDWQVTAAYREFERDAWIDAFTDTTWHLGGTNYKGFQVGGSYAIDKRAVLALRWTSTRNLDDGRRFLAIPGDPTSLSGNLSSAPLKIDVLQVDATVRF